MKLSDIKLPKLSISKTTLNGYLAFFIAAVPMAQANPQLHISPAIMAYLSFSLGLARLYVGITQSDADRTLAKVPGIADPVDVPAHPVPDDPKAKPVPKE